MLEPTIGGFFLTRPRPTLFSDTVSFFVPIAEIKTWRARLQAITRRVRQQRYRRLPLTLGLRCCLGCWSRRVRQGRYYGRLPGRDCHIVAVENENYLLSGFGELAAYPISLEEMDYVAAELAHFQ